MAPLIPHHRQAGRLTALQCALAASAAISGAVALAGGLPALALVAALAVFVSAVLAIWALSAAKRALPAALEPDPTRIANLTASRLEIVGAFEIERRRIERDLHDGAQQFLVATSMKLGEAALLLEAGDIPTARAILAEAGSAAEGALAALRRTVTGISPAVLSDRGLEAALVELASLSGNVTFHCPHRLPALPDGVATAVYFLTSEALTNAAKHAPGSPVSVLVAADEALAVSVVDEGPGGAVIQSGKGLAGLRERLAAFGGTLEVSSPVGGPTVVSARVPLLLRRGESAVQLGAPARLGESDGREVAT